MFGVTSERERETGSYRTVFLSAVVIAVAYFNLMFIIHAYLYVKVTVIYASERARTL